MVLNNWYIALKHEICQDNTIPIKSLSGTEYPTYGYMYSNMSNFVRFMGSGITRTGSVSSEGNYLIGSGTTPPRATDYKLEKQITSNNITVTSLNYTNSRRLTITNNEVSPITISEIGCACSIRDAGGGVLIDRTLLDTPITIEPGESGTIDYKIELQLPEE